MRKRLQQVLEAQITWLVPWRHHKVTEGKGKLGLKMWAKDTKHLASAVPIAAVSTEMLMLIVFSWHLDSVFSTKMHCLCVLGKDISDKIVAILKLTVKHPFISMCYTVNMECCSLPWLAHMQYKYNSSGEHSVSIPLMLYYRCWQIK